MPPTINVQKDIQLPDNMNMPMIGMNKSANVTIASAGSGNGAGMGSGHGGGMGPGGGNGYGPGYGGNAGGGSIRSAAGFPPRKWSTAWRPNSPMRRGAPSIRASA